MLTNFFLLANVITVPVGTGVLTMSVYQTLPQARITCLDYSSDMMERAKGQARQRSLSNVNFMQGDVGKLPFGDERFDAVLSLNGFHAFLDKEAAYSETCRVLKQGGLSAGAFTSKGRTDVRTGSLRSFIHRRVSLRRPTKPWTACGGV